MFSLELISLFNDSIVTNKFRNVVDIFFWKTLKSKQRYYPFEYFYCITELLQNARRYFSDHGKRFVPVQNNFPIEKWEKLGFITFKE